MQSGNFLQGMPCHKYIFRGLKNHAEAAAFERAFVDTLTSRRVGESDIVTALTFFDMNLGQNEKLDGYSFSRWDSNTIFGDDILANIRFDLTVPTYRCCTQLYKKYDEKRACCMLCPLSPKYTNALESEEQKLVRFAFASEENYMFLLDEGLTKDHFMYNMDLVESMQTQRPSLFPVYRSAFLALYSPDVRSEYYAGGCDSLTVQMQSFLVQCIRLAKPPKTYLTPDWTIRFCQIITDMIFNGKPCSKEEAKELVCALKSREKNPNKTIIGPKSNITASELTVGNAESVKDEQVTPAAADADTAPNENEVPVGTSDFGVAYDSGINTDFFGGFLNAESAESDLDDFITDKTYYYNESSVVDMDALMNMLLSGGDNESQTEGSTADDGVANSDPEDGKETLTGEHYSPLLPCPVVTDEESAPYDEWGYFTDDEPVIDVESRVVEGEELALVTIPMVDRCEYSQIGVSLDDGNSKNRIIFESGVLKGKQLCIEVVVNEEGKQGFVMWVPHLRNYFYCFECYKDVLSEILSYAKIEKLCFQPYMLYSVLSREGMSLKNVYSILSTYSVLGGGVHGDTFESIMNAYKANKAMSGVTYRSAYQCTHPYLLYIPSYTYVRRRQFRDVTQKRLLPHFEDTRYFDEAVGLSYLRSFLPGAAPLFEMSKPGAYKFIPYKGTGACEEGSFVTYKLTPGKGGGSSRKVLFKVIGLLAKNGRLKGESLRIACFGENAISFFVKKESLAYITTVINVTFLSYIDDTGDKGIEIKEARTAAEVVK